MNKMEKALNDLNAMDEMAAGDSPVHRLHPTVKLLSAVFYILTVMSFDKYDITGLTPMLLLPVFLYQLSDIPVHACFYKMRMVLPLVLAVGIFNPFWDRRIFLQIGTLSISGGVISMLTLMLKGILCLMASFLLIASTPFDSLCASLRQLHMPKMLVTLLLLTYRYIGVMTQELSIMTDAYHLRAPGQKGIQVSAWGSFLGQLLLRSMDRAQELYSSMLLRGYHQEFPYAAAKPWMKKDTFFLILCLSFCIFFRNVNAARLIGRLMIR